MDSPLLIPYPCWKANFWLSTKSRSSVGIQYNPFLHNYESLTRGTLSGKIPLFLTGWGVQGESFSTTRAKLSPRAGRQGHSCPCKLWAWVTWGWMAILQSSLAHQYIAGGKLQRMPSKGLILFKDLFGLLRCRHCTLTSAWARLALLWSKGLSSTTSFGTWCTSPALLWVQASIVSPQLLLPALTCGSVWQ